MPIHAVDTFPRGPNPDKGTAGTSSFVITKSNTDELPVVTRGIYVGGTGDLVVILMDDTASVTFSNIAEGVIHPLRVRKVLTATTATGLVGVY